MVFQSPRGSTAKWRENFAAAFRGFVGDLRRARLPISSFRRLEQRISPAWRVFARIFEKNEKRPRDIGYGPDVSPRVHRQISVNLPPLIPSLRNHHPLGFHLEVIRVASCSERNPGKKVKCLVSKIILLYVRVARKEIRWGRTSAARECR